MQERRKEKRISIIRKDVDILDRDYNEKIGTLVDISPKGLRMRGPESFEVDDQLNLQLRLPERILGRNSINLVAECVWCKPDENPNYWLSGFEFYSVSQDDSSVIIGLILETEKKAESPREA